MELKKREKILAIATGGIVALAGLYWVLSGTSGTTNYSLAELRRQCEAKRAELEKKQNSLRGQKANAEKLAAWEKISLPTRPDAARSAYQRWLRDTANKAKFRTADIFSSEGQPRKGVYTIYPFRLEGRASLDQLTRFLYEFYTAPHLHQIRRLSLIPVDGGKEFDLAITIEAAALATADRTDRLAEGRAVRLAHASADDYVRTIVRRRMEGERFVDAAGLFTPYAPPPPPVVVRRDPPPPRPDPPRPPDPPKPPAFDHAKFAFVTAILQVDGRPQVWIDARTIGKQFKLGEGESFVVGESKGVVKRIGRYAVEIELDGKSRIVTAGASLKDSGVVVAPSAGSSPRG